MEELRKELVSFWRKLGRMLDAGVPILQALKTVRQESSHPDVCAMVDALRARIQAGETVAEVLKSVPSLAPPTIQTMMAAAEATGRVDAVIVQIADGIADGTLWPATGAQTPAAAAAASTRTAAEEDPPVIKEVSRIILEAVRSRASDIHLAWMKGRLRVRYRIDGVLKEAPTQVPEGMGQAVISRCKIMANMNVAEKDLPQDGRIQVNVQGRHLDIRICVAPYLGGEEVVMRLLDGAAVVLRLADIEFTDPQRKQIRAWLAKPWGMILVTGPTGCGKTTTTYALLQELNTSEVNILTVEDPVECAFEGISQMQIRPHRGLTFGRALRSQLRQDPDILMATEIRDLETVQILVQAALTGHLVFSSLHTNDAPSALQRLMDIGVEPFLINGSLVGVIAQRLLRRTCQNCREEYRPEGWLLEAVKEMPIQRFVRGRGCERCNQTGYRGRIAVHEVLEMDDALRKLVMAEAGAAKYREQARASGMMTLRETAVARAAEGITTLEEIFGVCPA